MALERCWEKTNKQNISSQTKIGNKWIVRLTQSYLDTLQPSPIPTPRQCPALLRCSRAAGSRLSFLIIPYLSNSRAKLWPLQSGECRHNSSYTRVSNGNGALSISTMMMKTDWRRDGAKRSKQWAQEKETQTVDGPATTADWARAPLVDGTDVYVDEDDFTLLPIEPMGFERRRTSSPMAPVLFATTPPPDPAVPPPTTLLPLAALPAAPAPAAAVRACSGDIASENVNGSPWNRSSTFTIN